MVGFGAQTALRVACAGLLIATGCNDASPGSVRAIDLAILGADAAAPDTGIAFIRHTRGGVVCSGALIAPDLLVTAKHCVFEANSAGDQPMDVAGFRVGFGPTQGDLLEQEVDRVAWVGMPAALSIEEAVATGQDVALLHLSGAAPTGETVRDIDLTSSLTDRQRVRVAGFGVSSLDTGASGVRSVADGQVSGFDPATGIMAVSGPGVCYGDSGGPVLSQDESSVLGILGQVGVVDAGFCSDGLSFADTPANAGVQRLLAKECARVGGCGQTRAGSTGSAGASGAGDAATRMNTDGLAAAGMSDADSAPVDGGAPGARSSDDNPGSGCEMSRRPPHRCAQPREVLGALLGVILVATQVRKRQNIRRTKMLHPRASAAGVTGASPLH